MIAPNRSDAAPAAHATHPPAFLAESGPAGPPPPKAPQGRRGPRPGLQPVRDLHALLVEALARRTARNRWAQTNMLKEWKRSFTARGVTRFTFFAVLRCLCRHRCKVCGGIIGPSASIRGDNRFAPSHHFNRLTCSRACVSRQTAAKTRESNARRGRGEAWGEEGDEDAGCPSQEEIAAAAAEIRRRNIEAMRTMTYSRPAGVSDRPAIRLYAVRHERNHVEFEGVQDAW